MELRNRVFWVDFPMDAESVAAALAFSAAHQRDVYDKAFAQTLSEDDIKAAVAWSLREVGRYATSVRDLSHIDMGVLMRQVVPLLLQFVPQWSDDLRQWVPVVIDGR